MTGPVKRLLVLIAAPLAATACTLGYEIDERVRDRKAKDQGALVQSVEVEAVETDGEDLVLHVRERVHQRVLEKTYMARDVDLEVREGITGRPEDLIQNPALAVALSPLVAIDLATFTVSSFFTLPKAFSSMGVAGSVVFEAPSSGGAAGSSAGAGTFSGSRSVSLTSSAVA